MNRHRFWICLGFVLTLSALLVPRRTLAQGLGRIIGTVTDQTGAVVPNTKVTALRNGTGETTTVQSDNAGVYVFPSLAPAQYTISGSAPGFSTYTASNAVLEADQALTVNIPLKIGNATETVTVTDAPPQIDTTTGTISEVIGTAQTNELPLNGRNAATLTNLVAGVVAAPSAQADQGNTKTFPVAFTISANGTMVGQTNYLLDGANNVDEYTNVNAPFPMPDALQEFSVQTSNYSAEYGQNAGGVVNIVTKSGTNKFHGDLFEFIRNRAFNAANYFSYVNGVKTVDPLKRNQFGGTIGGPIVIPHLYNGSQRSYFFFGYQKTINHEIATSASAATLPTAAQLAGTFAGEKSCISDPLQPSAILSCTPTGSTFTTVVNPAAYSSPALKLLKYLPPTSALNANGGFTYLIPNYYDLGEVTARVDQGLTAKDKLTLRYFSDVYSLQGVLNLSNLLTYSDFAKNNYYNSMIAETHTFNDHMLNNFILSYQIENDSRGPQPGGIDAADLGVNIWQPDYKQINSIQASGDFNIGGNPQAFFRRANYTLSDDMHIQHGSHSIAFGYHGEVAKIDVNNLFRQPGNFTFNANNTGDAIASFLFGYVQEFSQASGQFFNARDVFTGLYALDSWKASRRLTLNYGMRWEPFKPWREMQGRMGSFFPNLWAQGVHSTVYPNAPAGLLFAGDKGFNPNGVPDEFGHFMPRIGFAYDVFGTGKTSVRGGFGTFYDSRINSTLFNIYTNTSPYITNVDVTNAGGAKITFVDPYGSYGTPNPFPAAQPPPSTSAIPPQGFLTFDPFHGFQDPITYNWNLAVEQQISGSFSTRVAYVGEHSSHNWLPLELNPFVNGTRVYNQPGCAANNSCYSSTLTATNTGGNMAYNSLQFSASQRLRYGLTVLANYTWSKALNDMPFNAAATSIGASNSYVYPINVANFKKLDYGPADFDHRNVASLSYVYIEPQVMKDAPFGLRYLANGWETAGLFVFRSGDPLTIASNSSNVSGSGQNRDRAIETGPAYGGTACAAGTHCKSYLNPASFTQPTAGNYGTFVKGSLFGPQYADWDVSAVRRFPFNERVSLVFRAEYFNVLNHTNFGDPNSAAGASNFGQITSTTPQNATITNDPRIAQFSLKLLF